MKSYRRFASSLLAVFAALAVSSSAHAQVSSWFRADFNNLNQSGSNLYNFATRYPQSSTTWQTTHTTNQGWNGSGAPHVVVQGCTPGSAGCNQSEHQFPVGWVSPPVGGARNLGDSVFIRYRIKFDANTRFVSESFVAKFILFGTTGTNPNSRWIIHLVPPFENQGCSLGFNYAHMGWTPPSNIWTSSAHFGLASNFDRSPSMDRYASFVPNVNISWSCAPGVLVTRSNHPAPVPKTQNLGAAATDGWYHLQFQAISGNAGAAGFRVWSNNNSQSTPSSQRLNLPEGLGVTGWTGGVHVAGYWSAAMPEPIGFVIDDFEIGPSFDPNWYPGAASVQQPSPPSNVRAD